ncbi:GAF and ANTAR domain-containing protein [Kribbella sp. CA-293567]|uniref:GAF and ANTAR domain-containing protein n=1 Tax=Kribbella sp. CA-293567 TaxID=3002436 RepID=UPI0022DD2AA5|nr:GAF and ANTAR domain-containing protein [Kribbella sp. CA-293567]WBQ03490.1 GAF and ANTAR domain-containing protein [Kribbella sp. CA-293567]
MTAASASQAFVAAAAAMVQQDDVAHTLATLLDDCAKFTGAGAVGLLVHDDGGRLELLSASSHLATELELYQLQQDDGPCVDAARDGEPISALTDADLTGRWELVGPAIVAAGFHAVHAVPLRWHGRLIGALNAFHTAPATIDDEARQLTQAFADIATIVIVQSTALTPSQLNDRIRAALAGRIVIEQAKGVLAQTTGLDPAAAYRLLVERASGDGATLTDTAQQTIRHAMRRG